MKQFKYNPYVMAQLIHSRLEFKNISARHLSKEIRISNSTLSRILRQEDPDVHTLAKLSSYFSVSPSIFFSMQEMKK